MSFAQQKLSELAVSIPGATKIFREYDLDFLLRRFCIIRSRSTTKES
ncbi:regulator of cell morphogenesis and cell wall metabolism [Haemophilus influenzae]|uniref:Regulator of cell morphogenesis and cell wall metabolism n=1 Tax=Haemophilus influenzae TaxID=727 RepID=A0A2X1PQ34_HAEIF|nr:regulator of cell morphogenesis and cell wall metabolism [Haemophilus influenzae]